MKAGAELLLEDDDERTEAFRYDLSVMMEAAPDTERDLAPIDDDDDGAMTMPFRRRALPPLSFIKALPVIMIGPAVEEAPPAAAPRGPQTLRMNAVPARARRCRCRCTRRPRRRSRSRRCTQRRTWWSPRR